MVPDLFSNYERHADAFRFIVDVPTDWEESIAVAGEVGDFVVMARKERGSEDWYLGAITDENARRIGIPLAFLDEGLEYAATIYHDADRSGYAIEERKLDRDATLELKLGAGGGAAVRIRPKTGEEE